MASNWLRVLVWLGVTGSTGLTLLMGWPQRAVAAPLTADFTTINNNFVGYQVGGDYLGGTGDFAGGTPDDMSYANVVEVQANYANNGVLTNRTTKIKVQFSDDQLAFAMGATITSFQLDVMSGHQLNSNALAPSLLVTNGQAPYDYGGPYTTSVFLDPGPVTFHVDLSHLSDDFPVIIGYRLTANSPGNYAGSATYALARFTAPIMAQAPTITSTVKQQSTQGAAVWATDRVVAGTGSVSGDRIEVQYLTADGTVRVLGAGTVQSDHQYQVKLKTGLIGIKSIRVVETNDIDNGNGATGATGTITATVRRPRITARASQSQVTFEPSDLDGIKSDAAALKWLRQKAKVQAHADNKAPITYTAKSPHLLTALTNLAVNAPVQIEVQAKTAAATTITIPLTVTKRPGTLAFGHGFASVQFGQHVIPAVEMKYAPADAIVVPIMDTRAVGAPWCLTASATPLVGTTGTFKGGIAYQSGLGKVQPLTNASVVVATGKRPAATTYNATAGWANAVNHVWPNHATGIFLDVLPGTTLGHYTGAIEWALSDTPTH